MLSHQVLPFGECAGHVVFDLEPYGLDNPNEVFYAADRPYGLIEAAVTREGQAEVPEAWEAAAAFCSAVGYSGCRPVEVA